MLVIAERPPTPEELADAAREPSFRDHADTAAWCASPMLALGAFGVIIGSLIGLAGGDVGLWPALIGVIVGSPITVLLIWFWVIPDRRARRIPLTTIETLRVSDARYAEMEQANDEGPHYFLQVDDDRLLFLTGQWMFDPYVVGDVDGDAPTFPSRDFALDRDPVSGGVLSLLPRGGPAPLVRTFRMDELPLEAEFFSGPSVLFDGTLEDLAGAIEAETRARSRIRAASA